VNAQSSTLPSYLVCGILALIGQVYWLHTAQGHGFPVFDALLLAVSGLVLWRGQAVLALINARQATAGNAAVLLLIAGMLVSLVGQEKFLASLLIWLVCVTLQAKIFESVIAIVHGRMKEISWFAHLFMVLAAQIVVLYFIQADSSFYFNDRSHYGTTITHDYFSLLSIQWWVAFFLLPALALCFLLQRISESPAHLYSCLERAEEPDYRRYLMIALVFLATILALLTVEMMRPQWGELVMLGDDSNYLSEARDITYRWRYMPSHQPLYTATLGVLIAVFGDWPQIPLIVNFVSVMGTFAMLFYAGCALTKNRAFGVLAALFFVGSRGTYLYVWTALTEPMNAFLIAAMIAAALYVIQKKSLLAYALFAASAAAIMLFRSQNAFFTLFLIAVTFLYIWRNDRPAIDRNKVIGFLVVFILLQAIWMLYQFLLTKKVILGDSRTAYLFLGYNSPGVSQGLDANAWEPNYRAWHALHPHAGGLSMILAGLRYRFDNPAETFSYLFWRAAELYNLRIVTVYGLAEALKENAQIIMLYSLFFLCFIRRWTAPIVTLIALILFYAPYLLVYSEHRYRYPGDVILYLGIARCLYETVMPANLPLKTALPQKMPWAWTLNRWVQVGIAAGLLLLALPNISGIERKLPGRVPTVQGAREIMEPEAGRPQSVDALLNQVPSRWAGQTISAQIKFDGYRFRVGNSDSARKYDIPQGNFNTALFESESNEVFRTKVNFQKFALDTERLYSGPPLLIGHVYQAHILLSSAPLLYSEMLRDNGHVLGYLLSIE